VTTRKQSLENALPLNFDQDMQYRSVQQCMPGAAAFLDSGQSVDLPMNNVDACGQMLMETGQMIHILKAELLKQRAGQVAIGYDQRRAIDDTMIAADTFLLEFANIDPALTRYPKDINDFEFYRAGIPQVPNVDYVLVNGVGILFTVAWAAAETGQLLIRSASQRAAIQLRWYKGSSFEGAGNVTADFAAIGADILGNVINPMPTTAAQIFISAPQLLTPEEDYTVAFAGGVATVTFSASIADDQTVCFRIEAGAV
jgi:hypothetical protein